MNLGKHVLATILATLLIVGAISIASLNGSSAVAVADTGEETGKSQVGSAVSHAPGMALGTISSIQNDETGKPAWVTSGGWKLFLMPSQNSNNTKIQNAKLDVKFIMTKLDGTSKHMHTISNLAVTSISNDGNTTTFVGTATMTMKGVPQKGIPITIKIMNHNTISISFDPSVNSHLGNTPLYGTVLIANSAYHSLAHMGGNKMMVMSSSGMMNGSDKSHEKQQQSSAAKPAKSDGNATIVQIVSGAADKADKAFSPSPATIKVGTEVTWKNTDNAIHTVTSGKNSTADDIFDSKLLNPNKEFKFKFDKAGTYDYFCQLHPAMVGEVIVG